MRQKLNLILTLFLAFVVQVSFAQEKKVTGTVTNANGMPLIGVNVLVQGTARGALTDFDGKYTISAAEGETLEFSYLGYATASKVVGAQSVLNITLKEDAAQLNEVVVVGYGATTKESFTGTAAVVSGEDLASKNVSDVSQALAGEVAGVRVINSSGQPGSSAKIRIRGFGSVNGNRAPLYVVDGIPYNGSISAINPADIKTTVVLKDASATAVYGSRGANGVILIQTKAGSADKSFIEITATTGQNFQLLPRYSTIESPEKYIGLTWEGLRNKGQALGAPDAVNYANLRLFYPGIGINPSYNLWNVAGASELIDPATGMVRDGVTRKYTPEDWEDYAFQPSNRTEANVKLGGGNDKTTYYASFGYLKDVGYSINSDFQRYSARLNLSHKVKEWLTGTINVGYTMSETNQNGQSEDSGSIFWFVDNMPSIYPLYLRDSNGKKIPEPIYGGYEFDYGKGGRGFGALTNAIADATYNLDNYLEHEINLSNTFTFDIYEGLTFETRFGMQYYNGNLDQLTNPFFGSAAPQNGSVFKRKHQLFSHNFLQLLRYKFELGKSNFEAFVAHETTYYEENYMAASKSELVIPGIPELSNGVVSTPSSSYTLDYAMESYFGQINYNYDHRFFASATLRRDGSSRFTEGNKWGTFGNVGAAWVISNEDFMSDVDWISNLKLKASYGLVGEQAGVGYYPGVDLFNNANINDQIAISFYGKGNPDLTWETSEMTQVGVEFGLGKYLDGSIDYYVKNTKDLLFNRGTALSLGYSQITVNDGKLLNAGLEFNLTAHLLDEDDYFLDINLNGSFLKNELKNMPIDPATSKEKILDVAGLYGRSVGHSLYDFYMREWAGVDAQTGQGTWYAYYAENGDFIPSMTQYLAENPGAKVTRETTTSYGDATRKYVGKSAIPDVRGAVSLRGGFKNFTLSVQMLYGLGGYGYDATYANLMHNGTPGSNNWHKDILNRWQKPGDVTDVPRLSSNLDKNVASPSTRFLIKKNYLSINNVRLGYTLPSDFVESLGMAKLNVWVSGDNLMLFNKRDGYNPMTSEAGQSSTYTYSPLSTVSAGINVSF